MKAKEDIATVRRKLLILRERGMFTERERQIFARDRLGLDTLGASDGELGWIREEIGEALRKVKLNGQDRNGCPD